MILLIFWYFRKYHDIFQPWDSGLYYSSCNDLLMTSWRDEVTCISERFFVSAATTSEVTTWQFAPSCNYWRCMDKKLFCYLLTSVPAYCTPATWMIICACPTSFVQLSRCVWLMNILTHHHHHHHHHHHRDINSNLFLKHHQPAAASFKLVWPDFIMTT